MKTNYTKQAGLLAFILYFFSPIVFGQCLTPPPAITCPVAGGISLTEGMVLTAGNTYVVTGTQNIGNITMSGGSLVICGTLNLANLTFNSGTINISPGGNFNYTNGTTALVMGANSNIVNYGNVNFSSSIVTGANNTIFNSSINSVFQIPFNQMVVQGPNTFFINNGVFNSSFFIVQSTNSAGVICSGNGSVITTNTMINQFNNAFTTPVGASCIQIFQQIINSQPMTSTSNVNICYQNGSVNVIQGPNFGSATINNGCTTCSIPLSVQIKGAKAVCEQEKIRIEWQTDHEPTPCTYTVQHSEDGILFSDFSVQENTFLSTQAMDYSAELTLDGIPEPEYFRVCRIAPDNSILYSETLTVDCAPAGALSIYPTMVTGEEITVVSNEVISHIILYAMDGKCVQVFPVSDKRETILRLNPSVANGHYLLSVQTKTMRVDKLLRIAH